MQDEIIIEGIRTNNLKNIDVKIIKKGINLIIGPSGSGKSSLAYDTIAQIGAHEFTAIFADEIREPSYKVKSYENMIPAVGIKQLNHNHNMRSTIGTYFGFNHNIGLIYAFILGLADENFVLNKDENVCEKCHGLGYISKLDVNKIVDFNVPLKVNPFKCYNRYKDFFTQIIIKFCDDYKIDCDKTFKELNQKEKNLLLYGQSQNKYSIKYKKNNAFSKRTSKFYGVLTQISMLTNFNISKAYYSQIQCDCCNGKKYNANLDKYKLCGLSIGEFMSLEFGLLKSVIDKISNGVSINELKFTINRLKCFIDKAMELNLGHLSFHRAIPTLSGGELQRLRLVGIFMSQIRDLLIVLDEPLAGLCDDEKKYIFDNIIMLSQRHTIVLIDHSDKFYSIADNIIALGSKGGKDGGRLIDVDKFIKEQSVVLNHMSCKIDKFYDITIDSCIYKYKGAKISFAINCMNLLTGFSGIGKSTLLREYLPQYFNNYLYINQKPLLGNKNSHVATILGINDKILKIFAKKYKKDKNFFSNLSGNIGACKKCEGAGCIKYGDNNQSVLVQCKECEGSGFDKNLKKFKIENLSIFDVWKMTLNEAVNFFRNKDDWVARICQISSDIMLGHLQIGQDVSTLSGGENIRIKLIKAYNTNAKIIGIDEPFKGLCNTEIYAVVKYLEQIRQSGRTLIIVDHTSGIEKYFSIHIRLENINDILVGKVIK